MKIFYEGVPAPIEFLGRGFIWEPVPAPSLNLIYGNYSGLFKENNLRENYTGLEINVLKPGEKVRLIDNDGKETTYLVKRNEDDGLTLEALKLKK